MDSETIEERLAPFLSTRAILVFPLTTLSVMFLLYGLYIPLFGLSIRVLWPRNNATSKLYLGFVISLFVIGTLNNACEAAQLIRQALLTLSTAKTKDYGKLLSYLHQETGKTILSTIINLTDILMNAIADFMLVHRCYSIWGSNRTILYSLGIIFSAVNGTLVGSLIASAIAFSNTSTLSNALLFAKANRINDGGWFAVAALNLLLTVSMAARIWWITREAREVMGKPIQMRYRNVLAVILESGLLYSSALLVALLVGLEIDPDDHGYVPIDLGVVTSQLSGIAPTLIIVRFAYGQTVNGPSVNQMGRVSTLQFAPRSEDGPGSTPPNTRSSSVHLPTDEDSDDVTGGELVAATILEK